MTNLTAKIIRERQEEMVRDFPCGKNFFTGEPMYKKHKQYSEYFYCTSSKACTFKIKIGGLDYCLANENRKLYL